MYIVLSIFAFYAFGIIAYEFNFYLYSFVVFAVLLYDTIKNKKFIYNIVIILFLILSFINCFYNSKALLSVYIDKTIELTAKIKTVNVSSNPSSKYDSFNASVVSIDGKTLRSPENTIIYVEKNHKIYENTIVKMKGTVADIKYSKNRLLFNYKNYLRAKKVHAVIFCSEEPVVIKEEYSRMNRISKEFRTYTEELFRKRLGKENADIVLSIILGDTDYLDEDFYESIKVMGLAHIFAVSGSHIVLMYGALLWIFRLCGLKRRPGWILSWLLIWFYGFLIGFPLSVLRTLVMFTIIFFSEILYRKYNSLNSIGLAALVLTIVNPYWIFDAGFLLSFSAALSLILFGRYVRHNLDTNNRTAITVYMYLFLQLFLVPVMAYYFNYIPVMGILYNLVLIPVFTVILVGGFVLLIFGEIFLYTFIVPFKVFNFILNCLRYFIGFTDRFGFNGFIMPAMSISEIIFFYLFILFSLYIYNNKEVKCKALGFSVLISFYAVTWILVPAWDKSLYLNIVDVGQGMYSTMSVENNNYIIDCGSTSSRNVGRYTAAPYLIKKGMKNINGIFISHWDSDHYSGLPDLLDSPYFNIEKIYSSTESDDINSQLTLLRKGNAVKIKNTYNISVLWPEKAEAGMSKNNSSLVMQVDYKGKKILFTGDIEGTAEERLTEAMVPVNILIVPHHGSATSSGDNFVDAVRPEIAVMSYGTNNYGIPSQEVIGRYIKAGSRVFSTFENGEINFILNGDKIYYNTYEGEKSHNYYELYLVWILPKLCLFIFFGILIYIYKNEKEVRNEL